MHAAAHDWCRDALAGRTPTYGERITTSKLASWKRFEQADARDREKRRRHKRKTKTRYGR